MSTFQIKQGDLVPPIQATLMQRVGSAAPVPIDLTTAVSVKFAMRNRSTGALEIDLPATVVSASGGIVKYQWVAGNTDDIGVYDCEWQITWGAGKQTVPGGGYDIVEISDDISA